MKKLILTFFTLIFLNSCAYLNSVSQTSIPKDRSNIVTAKVERNIILLMNFDNDYIDSLTQKLMDQCQNGSVRGILTKDENVTYFPIIFHKSIVTASGYCVEKQAKKSSSKKNKRG